MSVMGDLRRWLAQWICPHTAGRYFDSGVERCCNCQGRVS